MRTFYAEITWLGIRSMIILAFLVRDVMRCDELQDIKRILGKAAITHRRESLQGHSPLSFSST